MLPALIVLALVCVALAVVVVLRSVALGRATTRVSELEAQMATLESDLVDAKGRADKAEASATTATARALAEGKRADEADAAQKQAEIDRSVEADRAEAAATRAAAAEHQLALLPAAGLWALDERRVGRLWHERVSVTLDGASPVGGAPDPAQAAVQVFADASREESGVVVDLSWRVPRALTGAAAVLVVRVAEELIAAAFVTDGGELEVAIEGDAVTLRLRTEPPLPVTGELLAALEASGGTVSTAGGLLAVRLVVA